MMSDHSHRRRRLLAAGSAVILALAVVAPALAVQGETGTRPCISSARGYVHFRYNDNAEVWPPGYSWSYWWVENDNQYHVHEKDGALGGGYWKVEAYHLLDFVGTWASCRNLD